MLLEIDGTSMLSITKAIDAHGQKKAMALGVMVTLEAPMIFSVVA
jgi:hypothetical protein